MKNLLLLMLLLSAISGSAQCIGGVCRRPGEGATITAAMIVDNSFKYYQPSGFAGIGVHAGVWVSTLGATMGWVDSKVSLDKAATRSLVFTMMARARFFDEHVQAVPFFSVGSGNYQDIGLRVGYRIQQGAYLGAVASYQMKYGLSLTVSIEKKD